MTEVVVFHHAQGLTPGILAFADALCTAGHRVLVPDLYDGAIFDSLQAGIAHSEAVGLEKLMARGVAAAGDAPAESVYVGFSLGVMSAQKLAQTRAGAKGALLVSACVPLRYFGGEWPRGVPLQLHVMEGDRLGDVDIARQVASTVDEAELFLYPGDRHLFADSSLVEYDGGAAELLTQRVLAFLKIGSSGNTGTLLPAT